MFSRQTKSIVQLTVELNDELTQLTDDYVTNYNRVAHQLNDVIQNVSKNTENADVLPFIGSERKLMSIDDLNKLALNDYHLVANDKYDKETKDAETTTEEIDNVIEKVETLSLVEDKNEEIEDYELI